MAKPPKPNSLQYRIKKIIEKIEGYEDLDRLLLKVPDKSGACQGSCRLNYVMIPPIDEAAALAA
jgi:hypothetical protein